jgi:hypothetical protein
MLFSNATGNRRRFHHAFPSPSFRAALLTLVLAIGILASRTFAMARQEPRRDPESPITALIRQVLKKLHLSALEEISVPKP